MSPISFKDFESNALEELTAYGRIEAISPAYDAEWQARGRIDEAAELLAAWARTRKLRDAIVEVHHLSGRTPLLTVTVPATSPAPGTVVLYGHLDKQPPLGEWSEGLAPFSPTRVGDRLYGRGLADDGYSTFSALLALEDLEARGVAHARCVVLIEASEESGSPDLDAHLHALGEHLGDVELMLCLDSGALTYDRLWVTTSLRGNLVAKLRVDVLEQGRHSGSASGVVPSSFRILRQLLDRIEDATTGDVLLDELHVSVPPEHVAAAEAVTSEFGDVAGDEQPAVAGLQLMGDSASERLLRRTWSPTLSITGVGGIPDVAVAGNVLRPYSEVVLSLRVPPGISESVVTSALRRVVETNPPSNARVSIEFGSYAQGWEMPPLSPWLDSAVNVASVEAYGNRPGFVGEGGSIPFLAVLAERYPSVQIVATGVLGPASNAHGIDEMLMLPAVVSLTNAIEVIVAAHATANSPAPS